MKLSWGVMLYSTAMFNCLFFGVVLLILKRGEGRANRWLALFFITLSFLFLDTVLEYSNFYLSYPHFAEVLTNLSLLLGPFYFFYIREMTRPPVHAKRHLHFIPCLLTFLIFMPFYLSDAGSKVRYLNDLYADRATPYDWVPFLLLLSFISYLLLGLLLLRKHSVRAKDIFSNDLKRRNLAWLQYLTAALLIIWTAWANFHLFEIELLKGVTPMLAVIIIFAIGFFAIQQNSIFSSPELVKAVVELQAPEIKSPGEKDVIATSASKELADKLLTVMSIERPYLDNELTLPKLAAMLGASTNVLSETINKRLHQNFYDFINHYRVEESKRLLVDPGTGHLSILGIGFDAGFNSKTTFNAIFKNKVGMTPSEFRKKNTVKVYEPIEVDA